VKLGGDISNLVLLDISSALSSEVALPSDHHALPSNQIRWHCGSCPRSEGRGSAEYVDEARGPPKALDPTEKMLSRDSFGEAVMPVVELLSDIVELARQHASETKILAVLELVDPLLPAPELHDQEGRSIHDREGFRSAAGCGAAPGRRPTQMYPYCALRNCNFAHIPRSLVRPVPLLG
jgi:hypothetical protein